MLHSRYIEFLRQQLPRPFQSPGRGAGGNRRPEDARRWTELCQIHLWDAGKTLANVLRDTYYTIFSRGLLIKKYDFF